MVRVFGKFKNFNDAFGGLFVNFEVSLLDQGFKEELAEQVESVNLAKRTKKKAYYIEKFTSGKAKAVDTLQWAIEDGNDWRIAVNVYKVALNDLALSAWQKYDPKIEAKNVSPGVSDWWAPKVDNTEGEIAKIETYWRNKDRLQPCCHSLTELERQLVAKYTVDSQENASPD